MWRVIGTILHILIAVFFWMMALNDGGPGFWVGAIFTTLSFFSSGGSFNPDDGDFGGE